MSPDILSILPNWGVLGAFIFVVVYLVKIFMDYVKEKDKMVVDIHTNCENKLALIASDWKEVVTKNTEASADLKQTVYMLSEKLK